LCALSLFFARITDPSNVADPTATMVSHINDLAC
jgi:hypothetical protein